ncbi:hypothetical protein ACPA9J_31490 [Pseudomonas aeruginosa]
MSPRRNGCLPVEELIADITPETSPRRSSDELAMPCSPRFHRAAEGRRLSHRMWVTTPSGAAVASGVPGRCTLQFAPLSFDTAFQEIFSLCGGGELQLISTASGWTLRAAYALEAARSSACCCPSSPCNASPRPPNALGVRPRRPARGGVLRRAVAHHRRRPRVPCAPMPVPAAGEPVRPHWRRTRYYHSRAATRRTTRTFRRSAGPLDGVEVQVLDAALRLVPVVTGELHFGGDAPRARYHRAPEPHRRALRRTSLAPRRQALPHRRPRAHPRQRRDRLGSSAPIP